MRIGDRILEGRVAVVTGAASGIGRATAELCAREGARVVLADSDAVSGSVAARSIHEAGGIAEFLQVDVSQAEGVAGLVRRTTEWYNRLDILFNNAGIEGVQAPITEATEENWERVLAVNLKSVFLGMKYAIPAMLESGGGAIVNNASVAGLDGIGGLSAYCASKGGVVLLTKAVALEYAARGIRVNCVCPGAIRSGMFERLTRSDPRLGAAFAAAEPMGRIGTPEEVAQAVLFLVSPGASFITGASLPVNGGLLAG